MAKERIDVLELLSKKGVNGDVDFVREALRVLVDGIMDAEVSAQIGAEHGERTRDRITHRNWYRTRSRDLGWAPWTCTSRRYGKAATFPLCWSRAVAVNAPCLP